MLTTGLRTIEIARAKKRDISTVSKTHILYVHGKGEDEANQFVKLPARLTDAIASYLAMRTDTNPHVFTAHSNPLEMTVGSMYLSMQSLP